MVTMETLLEREGHSLRSLREQEVFEVLAAVPWARRGLAEYVKRHRPDLGAEVLASLEELGQVEE